MGWEVELNAIPEGCRLLELVQHDELDPELLSLVRIYFRLRRNHRRLNSSFAQGDRETETFVNLLEELIESHPGIEHRFCDLNRRFAWLQWLLVESVHEADAVWAMMAISGEVQVTPSARSVQGFPIRLITPETCRQIEGLLQGLDQKQLRENFDPDRMGAAQLYKWESADDAEQVFDSIVQDYQAIRQFYRDVSEHGEAILVVAD